MENSKADCREGEIEPSVDDGGVSVIADSHATQALDPAEGALHGPADTHQSRTVRVGRERMAVRGHEQTPISVWFGCPIPKHADRHLQR